MKNIINFIKKHLPGPLMGILRWLKYDVCVTAILSYPLNMIRYLMTRRDYCKGRLDNNRRIFNYRYQLLPNQYLSNQEVGVADFASAQNKTGLSLGYPAWNLLYYSLVCSLHDTSREAVVIETGTNLGYSTIIMAQALCDVNAKGYVHTVDIDKDKLELAKQNVEKAGLSSYVKFYNEDALVFLSDFVKQTMYIDFIFIDDLHEYVHVKKEFSVIYPKIIACNGKVYFDNISQGDVRRALLFIRIAYPGNTLEFNNCSLNPPGNAIWQP